MQPGAGDAQHFRALVERRDAAGLRGEEFRHAARARADIEQRAERALAQRAGQRRLDRTVGAVQPAQDVPFGGVAGKIGLGAGLPGGADRGKVAAVFVTAGGKGGIALFGDVEQAGGGGGQRRCMLGTDRAAQEHPRSFLAPFGQRGIAQNANMARDPRLALPQHLGKLSHRQLHR